MRGSFKTLSIKILRLQSSVSDDDAFYPEDPNSPEVLRVRQEQAYRSVGALQLRVEELTLEVTKVGKSYRVTCLLGKNLPLTKFRLFRQ